MEVPSKLVTEELDELFERLRAHDAKQHEQQIDCEKRNYLAERAYRAFVCEPRDKRSADNIYGYRTTKDSHVSKCCHKKSAPADEFIPVGGGALCNQAKSVFLYSTSRQQYHHRGHIGWAPASDYTPLTQPSPSALAP